MAERDLDLVVLRAGIVGFAAIHKAAVLGAQPR
jgi:hypothetical protein